MKAFAPALFLALGLASCNSVPALPTYTIEFPEMAIKTIPNWDEAVANLPCSDFTIAGRVTDTDLPKVFPSTLIEHKWRTSVTIVADGKLFEPGEIEDPGARYAIERKFADHIGPGC